MSQMPPYHPPPPPPPGYGPPPPGYGAPGPGFPVPQNPSTSGAAIASLICGFIFCIPLVTPLVAIIAGVIGIGATKNPYIRGRGMAIAGIVLGLLALLLQVSVTVGLGVWWSNSAPQRIAGRQFITDLAQGKTDVAATECTDNITSDQLQIAADQLKKLGAIQRIMLAGFGGKSFNGEYPAGGSIIFTSGQSISVSMVLKRDDSGNLKVNEFQLVAPGSLPTPAPSQTTSPSTQQ